LQVNQLSLDGERRVPEHRVRALAGVMAGFRWPGCGPLEKLKPSRREAALDAARVALEALEGVE